MKLSSGIICFGIAWFLTTLFNFAKVHEVHHCTMDGKEWGWWPPIALSFVMLVWWVWGYMIGRVDGKDNSL